MRPLLALLALSACTNPCQDLCVQMAEVARSECGLNVPANQIDQCETDYQSASFDDRGTCRRSKSAEQILSTWTCDDLADYFNAN